MGTRQAGAHQANKLAQHASVSRQFHLHIFATPPVFHQTFVPLLLATVTAVGAAVLSHITPSHSPLPAI